jgi:dUTPase
LLYIAGTEVLGYDIPAGTRIAQLIITKIATPDIEIVESFRIEHVAHTGFGSTGLM